MNLPAIIRFIFFLGAVFLLCWLLLIFIPAKPTHLEGPIWGSYQVTLDGRNDLLCQISFSDYGEYCLTEEELPYGCSSGESFTGWIEKGNFSTSGNEILLSPRLFSVSFVYYQAPDDIRFRYAFNPDFQSGRKMILSEGKESLTSPSENRIYHRIGEEQNQNKNALGNLIRSGHFQSQAGM